MGCVIKELDAERGVPHSPTHIKKKSFPGDPLPLSTLALVPVGHLRWPHSPEAVTTENPRGESLRLRNDVAKFFKGRSRV